MAEQEMLLTAPQLKPPSRVRKWATEKVIEHYAPMIDELAVDEDMKQHLVLVYKCGQKKSNNLYY